jgi:hypothetical protein
MFCGRGGGIFCLCRWGENIVPRSKYSILSACAVRVPKVVTQAANTQVALTLLDNTRTAITVHIYNFTFLKPKDGFKVHVKKNHHIYSQEK